MRYRRYDSMEAFDNDVLEILLENEVQNNLLLSLITKCRTQYSSDWLLAAVSGDGGGVELTALYIKPFTILLYETGNKSHSGAVELLGHEIRAAGCAPSGVMAETGLARRFADTFTQGDGYRLHMTMAAMRLDKLAQYEKAPGACRLLEDRDMFFAPYWERAFSEDCRSNVFSISENVRRLNTRLSAGTHYLWEDGVPVSQAVHGRNTPNGAVVNMVYTPPHYRGHGYAKSVVAELSKTMLERGRSFCCLLADADNPVSCGMYLKLGYYDVCRLEDIRFDTTAQ